MDRTTLTLAVDSTQVGTAAAAFERMTGAGNAAAATGGKVTRSANAQAKAVIASAAAASKGKVAFADLAAAAAKLSPNAVVQITAALAAASAEASKAAANVKRLQIAGVTSAAPSARTPLLAPAPIGVTTRQPVPVGAAVLLLAAGAGRAQSAIDHLTNSARTQASVLGQLAPAAAATATSYRQLAARPITLTAPQGLSNAAAALSNAATQATAARVALTALGSVPAPARAAPAAGSAAGVLAGAAAARVAAQGQNALATATRRSNFETQQLHFQLHDFFVQVASGQSPLTAFIQQGSQLSGTFGGAGGAFRAVLALLTPMTVGVGAAVAAVGALAYAFYEGTKQSKAFADSLVLTGNYAGQTEGKFNEAANKIAANGRVTIGTAREVAQALLNTGEIGPQVFSAAVEAATAYSKATGKTAEDVAKDFAQMARAPTKFAIEANRSLNFITAAQHDSIKSFEENGRSADAQGVIYDALNERFKGLDGNLTRLDRALIANSNMWSKFWDAAVGNGRAKTVADQIADIDAKLRGLPQREGPVAPGAITVKRVSAEREGLVDERRELLRKQFREGENAAGEAFKAEATKAAIAADTVVDGYLKRGKAATTYKQKLDELSRSFRDKEAGGVPVSAADKKVALTQLKKDFTNTAGASEASQVLKAQLEKDLAGYQDAFERERDAISLHNRLLDGAYQAGKISLKAVFDDKRQSTADGVAKEIAELENERVRLEQFKKQSKDPSDKVNAQTRIDKIGDLQDKIRTRAAGDLALSNQQEEASFKALSDQVTNYRANLLQMQGDEEGAAKLRAQIEIANAKVLARQSGGRITDEDVEKQKRLSEATIAFAKAQREVSLVTASRARAEEAFALVAEQSGKSLIDTERGVYAIRVKELDQLGALAAKAKELADVSTDQRIKDFAADLALEYAKAAAAVDPALNRLREANRELAAGIAGSVSNLPNAFADAYLQRRADSNADIKNQKDEYDQRISILEGYLSKARDATDKARFRAKIKDLEDKKAGVKGESHATSVFGALGKSIVDPVSKQIFATVNKLLITDPLQKYLEGQLKGLTEGGGPLAGIFADALGIQADPKDAALAMQTAAIASSTSALDLLTQAANAAAGAMGGAPLGEPGASPDQSAEDAAATVRELGQGASSAASDVSKLATAAGAGGGALGRLPSIVSLFQSAVASMSSTGGGGGGLFSGIAGLFGGSGGIGYEEALVTTGIFHQGGVVGSPPATRSVASSVFAGAPRYHTGGIVGRAADKLKSNEVAAILMGGPKGRREEVLHASDPRHRDNLGMNALAKIMAESKHEGMRVRGARELGGPVSANSMYRVNEKRSELLQVAGKQYLMTGSQGGTVLPNAQGGQSQPIHQTINFHSEGPVDRRTQSQLAAAAFNGSRRATSRTS